MDEPITVERVRDALVVGRLDADGAAVLLAANLPVQRERTFVVVGASSVDAMRRLDPWVTADLADEVRGDVCVVAPRFGSMGRDGTLPPARLLADRLGVEVTAADGDPVGLADGSVFVPGPTAGWVSFHPGGRRVPVGARLPAPWWQEGLPAPAPHLTHVPAGLWIRRPDAPPRPGDPLLAGVPDRDRMYVVLGAPGELPPTGATVAEVLRALPDHGRDRAVLAWYGSGAMADAMAPAIAEELGTPVRVAHGVPGDGGLVHVDERGVARWRPFAVESVYRPHQPPVLDRWVAPPSLATAGPGSFRLADGWRVDVVPRGLVVRPESVVVDAATLSLAGTGPTADIVFAADGPVPADVLSRFDALVRELPADTREALRVLAVDERAAEALAGSAAADRVVPAAAATLSAEAPPAPVPVAVPAPTGAIVVTADGRVLPAAPILTVEVSVEAPAEVTEPAAEPATEPAAAPAPAVPETVGTVDIQDGVLVITLDDTDTEPEFDATTVPEETPVQGIPSVAAATTAPSVLRPAAPVPGASAGSESRPPSFSPTPRLPDPPLAPAQPAVAAAALPGAVAAGALPTAPAPTAPRAAQPALAPDVPAPPVAAPVAASPAAGPSAPPAAQPVPSPAADVPVPPAAAVAAPPTSQNGSSQSAGPVSVAAQSAALPATVPSAAPAVRPATADSLTGLLPAREPRPPAAAPAATTIEAPVEIPENARSTPAQRRAMRTRLGARYDVATRAVTRLLSERPGLRFGAGDRAALLAELAVVRVFADDPDGRYDADFYVCLADGLRRLPTARAVVVRGIPADTDVAPESVLRLPAPVVAAPVTAPGAVGPAEALIWTTTARRLDGLLDRPEPTDDEDAPAPAGPDVVLSGHTRLRVLAVEQTPVRRILLAEDGAAPEAALTRLRAAAAARAAAGPAPDQAPATSRWFGPLPATG